MNIEEIQLYCKSNKISFTIHTKYHISIKAKDGNVIDYYPTKSSCMVRGIDDKSSSISDDELISMINGEHNDIDDWDDSADTGETPVTKYKIATPNPTGAIIAIAPRKLKFSKAHKNALPPHKTYETDAGIDLFALEDVEWDITKGYNIAHVKTVICLEIPRGFVLIPAPRSSMLFGEHVSPFVSIIDAGYLGEVTFLLFNFGNVPPNPIKRGQKVAQVVLLPIPEISCTFEEVNILPSHSSRGYAGFGSTSEESPFDI